MLGIQNLKLEEVQFQQSCAGNPQTYSDFFWAPVFFEQAGNAFNLSKETINVEIPEYDAHLQAVLKKQADDILEKLSQQNEFLDGIEKIIFQNLATGILDIEMVAKELNMHRVTLHRKLKAEDTSFSRLLTTVRKRLAEHYLEQGMNTDQISFLLDIPTAAIFKWISWFGKSPGSYKKNLTPST